MADSRARSRNWTYRQGISLVLREEGFSQATPRPYHARPSLALAEDPPLGDVLGVPGWILAASTATLSEIGPSLDTAQTIADLRGVENAALIQHRRGHPFMGSFVILSPQTWTRLVHAAEGQS